MSTDYEEFYKDNPHGLGEPFKEFVNFFRDYKKKSANVLDLGCGQGRDAIFIARLGHVVTGVDISKTGIDQLCTDAKKESLSITGIVADVKEYNPTKMFDVVIIDRSLHTLPDEEDRISILKRIVMRVTKNGHILIADEKKNLPAMKDLFIEMDWEITLSEKGFLFVSNIKPF